MKQFTLQRFTFLYHLDLGNNNVKEILINQDSDPYIEASKLCAKNSLPSIFITIIGDAIRDQINQQIQHSNTSQHKICPSKRNYLQMEEIQVAPLMKTMHTQLKQEQNQLFQTGQDSFTHSNLQNSSDLYKNFNIFEHLYNNHKEIQSKKQKIRKHSFESIPFKPKINNVSDKIVEKKRSQLLSRYLKQANNYGLCINNDDDKIANKRLSTFVNRTGQSFHENQLKFNLNRQQLSQSKYLQRMKRKRKSSSKQNNKIY